MGDLFFLIKAFFLTAIIVVLMQVKVGRQTIEESTHQWLTQSAMGGYLTEVAQGLVYFAGLGVKNVRGTMNDKFTEFLDKENAPGMRTMKFHLERSKEFLQEKYEQARESVEERVSANNQINGRKKNSDSNGEPEPASE